ncbi:SDR family oxidoreductase [Cytophagaceae bacterium 50C-KIRBA]|uniref:SDR family oxidoreductase n=1 Tax=Aquirufa beregesia TaxID=2516556 RepID=A0ABX0EXG2_9BACT|nr:SDR family oxidoreductase [Aquirufa beregesia]NGZ45139.1 SDR family oxidoreductase [Aquirufa beregesia]
MSQKPLVAIITGASKGIGKALALLLAEHNFQLGLIARSKGELKDLAESIAEIGHRPLYFVGDVADESFVNYAVEKTAHTFQGIDFLINNAGSGVFGPTESYTVENWDQIYNTNVKGTFLFSKAVLASMKAAKKGHIISIASDVAKRVFDGGSLYCSSKYAQHAFTEALRKEVRKDGIKVSTVYSGLVDTMFHPEPQGDQSHQAWLTCENMADSIYFIMNQPPHVVIDELMVHPLSQEY